MALPLSNKKKILFSLLPVTGLVLLFVGVEAGLRLFLPSHDTLLTSVVSHDGIEWYQIERGYLKKYFPSNTPLIPEFKTSLFKKRKDSNLFRIMCLGESSMFGTPYDMNANIPGIVRKQLRHQYPDKEIEVINWGASAINSNVIYDLSRQLLVYEPDLILVYMGHNEYYGPDGVGASFIERHLPLMTQVKYRLRELRLVQLFQSWLRGRTGPAASGVEFNLMHQVSQGNLVPLKSPDAERVSAAFERNLKGILDIFRERHVPVIVSDVGSNLLFPPFVSDTSHAKGNRAAAVAAMRSGLDSKRFDDALRVLNGLYGEDSTNAFVNYWMGRTLISLSKAEEARVYLVRARDQDLLKFRAPERINGIIHQVCKETGTACVSADSILAAASPYGIAGDLVFWEHLHPTSLGYYLIANQFVRTIVSLNLVPISRHPAREDLLPFNMDSLSICWLELAYADRSIQHLTSRWPFEDYKRAPVVLNAADEVQRRIVEDVYGLAIGWDEGCYISATHFWRTGRLRDAVTTYEALLEEYPYNFYTNYLLGTLLSNIGNTSSSIACYKRSIQSNPQYAKSRLNLGLIEVNQGDFDEAIRQLNTVLDLLGDQGSKEDRATALYGLAACAANLGDIRKALSQIDRSLALVPNYQDALNLRAKIMKQPRQ